MLTEEDKEFILQDFPNVKLSYETILHKKVNSYDIITAIPDGIKCFVWFTTFNHKFMCLLFELESGFNKQISNISVIQTCFSKSLCYGTLLYGTLFRHKNNSFFCIEDIFFYKNKDLSGENWVNKFNNIIHILKNDMKQISYNKHFVIFGLPIIAKSNKDMENMLQSDISYKIKCIQYYEYNKRNHYASISLNSFNKIDEDIKNSNIDLNKNTQYDVEKDVQKIKHIILEIKPDIQNDIYLLYSSEGTYCGEACVPDYETSKYLNSLFRIIKENDDLDKLEESDDEEEFENPNLDKFVYLDKVYKMRCRYNKRFKKWMPIEAVDFNIKVSSFKESATFIEQLYKSTFRKNGIVRH